MVAQTRYQRVLSGLASFRFFEGTYKFRTGLASVRGYYSRTCAAVRIVRAVQTRSDPRDDRGTQMVWKMTLLGCIEVR